MIIRLEYCGQMVAKFKRNGVPLPTPSYGCVKRTQIARQVLRRHEVRIPNHCASDLIVEAVERTLPDGETWQLGS